MRFLTLITAYAAAACAVAPVEASESLRVPTVYEPSSTTELSPYCVSQWRMRSGDTFRSGSSCYVRPEDAPGAPAVPSPSIWEYPSDGVLFSFYGVDTFTQVFVLQATGFNLYGINSTTGEVLWTTYNVTGKNPSESCSTQQRTHSFVFCRYH
jgi:hypothetical protein